ncbi:helix-turn-helix domain-containing protein [Chitinophaga eiseniae]|uniref:Helix-turn-helix transcriptional regulator n=1 Tax=Chitinophaga eiseniae TaxID=634771 RepID=A0A847SXI0_9BACT|nr:helix-turn-helix transcriptional regulator [Chitinophaga eiseniae]NLR82272.1 helix-turn-helix transcriptional regulator [Chitinophaga eiseniae]
MATDKKVEIVEFGRKVQHYRKALGWSQDELAAVAGIEPKQVSKVERGASDIRLSTAMKLIWALKVAPNDVIPFSLSESK